LVDDLPVERRVHGDPRTGRFEHDPHVCDAEFPVAGQRARQRLAVLEGLGTEPSGDGAKDPELEVPGETAEVTLDFRVVADLERHLQPESLEHLIVREQAFPWASTSPVFGDYPEADVLLKLESLPNQIARRE
jgi:hypothetical protein